MSIAVPRRGFKRRRDAPRSAARMPPHELFGIAVQGLRTRRLRASLSALGIAIGIGAMVAVVGVSASSQANLFAQIDKLGTNLLTVAPGQTFFGANEVLPSTSLGSIDHMSAVLNDAAVYQVTDATVRRTTYVPAEQSTSIENTGPSPANPPAAGAGAESTSNLVTVTRRGSRSTSMPSRASWCSRLPPTFSAETMGGTWSMVPVRLAAARRAASSVTSV